MGNRVFARRWGRFGLLAAATAALAVFVTGAGAVAPVATTTPASSVTQTSATLNGDINPGGEATTYQFEYGTTTSYGSTAPASPATAGSGTAPVSVSQPISGLTAGTTYHYRVVASNASASNISGGDAQFTTLDPTISIGDGGTVSEGATPASATFNVSLSAASSQTVTVNYAVTHGTTNASDFTGATSGTVTFSPSDTSEDITLAISNDGTDEPDTETYTVTLSSPSNATIADGSGSGSIQDDDSSTISIGNAGTVTEGATATFIVSLSAANSRTVTVNYAVTHGTTTSSDFTGATSGTVTFDPGDTSQTISVVTSDDGTDEDSETYTVTLSSPSNATIADGSGSGSIQDNDQQPTLSISDFSATEGNSGTKQFVFTVTPSQVSGRTIKVDWATAPGSATANVDYAGDAGTLTLAQGAASGTITVLVNGDIAVEGDEDFFVNLSQRGDGNAGIGDGQGRGLIQNDDSAGPSISINDVIVNENAGNAAFTVTLTGTNTGGVIVNYSTADGTATAGSDYTAKTSQTLNIPAGQQSGQITVAVTNDTTDEADETFFVNLTGATGGVIADNQGQATILDDDPLPTLTIANASVTENDAGDVNVDFTVTLAGATARTVTVNATTADGTATTPNDYAGKTQLLTFAPGETTKTFTVAVKGDAVDEFDETFVVNLLSPSNAQVADGQAIGTIIDNDAAPTLSINNVQVNEGNSGTALAQFTVTLSARSEKQVSVSWATADGSATAPADYQAGGSAMTFGAGTTNLTQTATVVVKGDTVDEANESFSVILSNPTNATLAAGGTGIGTIVDDDGAPSLTVLSTTVAEGSTGTATAIFTVTLAPTSGQLVTVNWATANGTATAPADYTAASGTLTFAPGESTKTFSVLVSGDTLDEDNESFTVNLTGATNAGIGGPSATGTITDDDAAPTVSVGDAVVTEGDTAPVPAVFTVTLSTASGRTATVAYTTADGTAFPFAVAGQDYTETSGTLTFAAGETSKTVSVPVLPNTTSGANKQFFLRLTTATNASIADATGVGTIVDNDACVSNCAPPPTTGGGGRSGGGSSGGGSTGGPVTGPIGGTNPPANNAPPVVPVGTTIDQCLNIPGFQDKVPDGMIKIYGDCQSEKITLPRMTIRPRSARPAKDGFVTFTVGCPTLASRTCSGKVALEARIGKKTMWLGTTEFALIAAGRSEPVDVQLTKRARYTLEKLKKLSVTAVITFRDSKGKQPATKVKLTLLAPKVAAPAAKKKR